MYLEENVMLGENSNNVVEIASAVTSGSGGMNVWRRWNGNMS